MPVVQLDIALKPNGERLEPVPSPRRVRRPVAVSPRRAGDGG